MQSREARAQDAPAIARVHVESWRTTYCDILPDDFPARLSAEGRARRWTHMLREKQIEIGGAPLDEIAYGWTDTRTPRGRAGGM